jgi:hypothetical protein
MGYGPTQGFLYLSFERNFLPIHYYVFILLSSWRWQSWLWFRLWDLSKTKRLFQHWHLWRQDFKTCFMKILSCWFICMHKVYYMVDTFPYDDVIITWIKEKHGGVFWLKTLDHLCKMFIISMCNLLRTM